MDINKPSITWRGLNVRGLKDDTKRLNMLEWLKGNNTDHPLAELADINLLSDTHCNSPNAASKWAKQWSLDKKNSIWSLGTSKRKGVAILFNDKLRENYPDMKVSHVSNDSRGRFIKCILTINECKFRILVVYAPNNPLERINFFLDLAEVLNDGVEDAENICGGDWNCAMNTFLDRLNCVSKHNDSGQTNLNYLCNIFDLEDVWRRRYPTNREYTWTGKGKYSRIDFWLTSRSLNSQIDKVYICFAPFTDHSAINLVINTEEVKRGKGTWKMNTDHLLHNEFKKGFIEMWEKWKLQKKKYSDIKVWWDVGKKRIQSFAQSYAMEYNTLNRSKLRDVEEKIDKLRKANADYEHLQKEYEDLFSNKCKGARVRSRIQHWEEGEKSTKYFFGLEKRNSKEKSWSKIFDKNGHTLIGTRDIQNRQVEFYKDLYKSQNLSNNAAERAFFLSSDNVTKQLSDESKELLDSDISLEEMKKALIKMKNNKSPGPDGLCIEFYKLYWSVIADDLYDVFITGLEDRQLAYTQYLATIVLLYKKGPRPDIRNWRPIALLNTDYKLLSKIFAERIRKVLPEIIHSDQKGCVSGRYMGENIRLIDDILFEIENQSPDSIILQLDQEKAFDRVEWDWLFSVLSFFNFGDVFIENLKTLYRNAKVSIMTNGYQSQYFNISRGIRQGDSLSALLYVIQFEPLMSKIRNSPHIEGVTLDLKNLKEKVTVKGCQYVDDSNSSLKNIGNVPDFFEILKKFEKISGSKVNFGKTVCLTVDDHLKDPSELLNPTIGPEKVLGAPLGKNRNDKGDFWDKRIKKLEAKLNIWRLRNLSFEGKSLIIRSLGVSQITNALENLSMSEEHIKRVNKILFNFLWSGKNVKMKKEICFLPRDLGGLNIVNIETLIKVKRIQWVIRCLKETTGQPWAKLIENYLRCLDNDFNIDFFALKVTDSADSVKKVNIPDFYKECILSFQELLRTASIRHDNEIVWCNDKFKFNGKVLQFKHWSTQGLQLLGDLYKDGALSKQLIKSKLTKKSGIFFEFWRMKKAVPNTISKIEYNENLINGGKEFILNQHIEVPDVGLKPLKDLTSKELYSIFNLSNIPDIPSKRYWSRKFNIDDIDWKTWYQVNTVNHFLPRPVKDYNFKIIYNLVNTERKLFMMKYSTGKCVNCKIHTENLEHLLYSCSNVKHIWHFTSKILKDIWPHVGIGNIEAISGLWNSGVSNEILIINTIIGIVRFHIWKIRNRIKYGQEVIPSIKSLIILKCELLQHLEMLKSSKKCNPEVRSLLEGVIGKIKNTSLQDNGQITRKRKVDCI